MVLVVVAQTVIKVHVSLEVLGQVEGEAAGAWLHKVLLDVFRTCDILIIFLTIRIVDYLFFDLKRKDTLHIVHS